MMEQPIVEICDGKVQGTISENLDGEKFYSFLGIPYGKPPTGQLRFKAPEPICKWEGVKDCTNKGPKCVQIEMFGTEVVGSEDCLHLNVFTKQLPDENIALKPVMVWLFGGKFLFGSNDPSWLGPEFLLLEDIVLVVPNSRMGLLGFLELKDPSLDVPGNAGMKDQVLALQWIQKNIKVFGGDPMNVTLAGHSSGAMAVHYHLLSDSSKGLFQKAIIMSGSVVMNYTHTEIFDLKIFADVLNIKADTEREILEQLQNMPPEIIVDAQERYQKLYELRGLIIGPVVEKPNRNSFLTEDPLELLWRGKFQKVPILATYAEKERLLFVKFEQLRKKYEENKLLSVEPEYIIPPKLKEKIDDFNFKIISSDMEKVYSSNEFFMKMALIHSDVHFIMPLVAAAQTHAEYSDEPVFLMRWSVSDILNYLKTHRNSLDLEGCTHGDELGYIFKMETLPTPTKGSSAFTIVKRFAQIMKNFCTHGDPATDFAPNWQPLQKNNSLVLDFGQEVSVKRCPEEERMMFWKNILNFDRRNIILNTFKTA